MASIKPFKAYRPLVAAAHAVVSGTDDLPWDPVFQSLLNITHKEQPPQFDGEATAEMEAVPYSKIREHFNQALGQGHLEQDEEAGIYIYQICTPTRSHCGFLALSSVEDYARDHIRKHENILAPRAKRFATYLQEVGYQSEPVLLTHKDNDALILLRSQVMSGPETMAFSTPDGHEHQLWQVTDAELIKKIQACFEEMEHLYIADGHHRVAASQLLVKEHAHHNNSGHFMAYLLPESEITIHGFNRLVRTLGNHSTKSLLAALEHDFNIEEKGAAPFKPGQKGIFCMYLDGKAYQLVPKSGLEYETVLHSLDVHILAEKVFVGAFGMDDADRDAQVVHCNDKIALIHLQNAVDSGEYAVAFCLHPVIADELRAVADAHLTMPPKSTYIEPKLTSGAAIYALYEPHEHTR